MKIVILITVIESLAVMLAMLLFFNFETENQMALHYRSKNKR